MNVNEWRLMIELKLRNTPSENISCLPLFNGTELLPVSSQDVADAENGAAAKVRSKSVLEIKI